MPAELSAMPAVYRHKLNHRTPQRPPNQGEAYTAGLLRWTGDFRNRRPLTSTAHAVTDAATAGELRYVAVPPRTGAVLGSPASLLDVAMPNTPTPAPKVNGLIRRLASLSESAVVTDFALERISRDARDLMRADPAGANTVLGGIAALRGDLEACRRHHQTALRIDRDFTHQFNYSISLSHLEENAESLKVAYDALRVYPDSLELIDHAITAAVNSGSFIKAKELCDRWDVVSPMTANRMAPRSRQLAAAVETGLFTERGVGQVLGALSDVQRAEGVRTSNAVISSDDIDGGFLYQRFIHATPAEASTLNERLADRIADHPDLMEDPGLRFVVVFTGEGSPDGRIP